MPKGTETIERGCEAAFPPEEFARRQAMVGAAVAGSGHAALIVTSPETIYWLTGWQTAGYFAFQALIVRAEGDPVLLVRQLEHAGALAATWLKDIRVWQDGDNPAEALARLLADLAVARPAMEKAGWFVSPLMAAEIEARLGAGPLPDGSALLPPLRMVKSAAELSCIRKAAGYAEAGLAAAIAACREGASENMVAAAMIAAAIEAGSEAFAMEPLVSSGPRSGLPHMTWRRRAFEKGDAVFLEMAGSHARYHAALMRSVFIGAPSGNAWSMMRCAQEALDAALAEIRPGAPCSAAHDAARSVIDAAGYTQAFRKRVGYSMGVAFAPDWGEGAILSLFTGTDTPLEAGMVFHLPVTLRSWGEFTVGASETVIVTGTGCEVLSRLPRDMALR